MKRLFVFLVILSSAFQLHAQGLHQWKNGNSGGYDYRYVTNDPMKTRFYTLKNGLTVILTQNTKEPRIAVRIAVRAGSNTDPKEHTGLAHYLEHLLFKGTDKFGTLNWSKEKPYLDQVDSLYEKYNSTINEQLRKAIYRNIDSISGIASMYAIANEYDKLMMDIGSEGTNAHTWVEETVYQENIPSNSIDKFLVIQAERFRNPIFRLFHTELESVYEEKNRALDNDENAMQESMMYYLFPTHNYGQQTTIGTIEHLKNPSLLAIKNYYKKYYVPNNIAIVMSGDFESDKVIKKIDQLFAYMKAQPVDLYNPAPEQPIAKPIIHEIKGPSAEQMRICYRTPAANTRDALVLDLIGNILNNGKAGIMDIALNMQQKVQSSFAGMQQYKDYGIFIAGGTPRQGQSLEQVRDLVLTAIEQLKKGEFDEQLIAAIVANNKLSSLQSLAQNNNRVQVLVDAFIKHRGASWDSYVRYIDEQAGVSKKEIIEVANRYFMDNYVLLFKRNGTAENITKIDKPHISPVALNADKQSAFVKKILNTPVAPIAPVWLDFEKDVTISRVGNMPLYYVQNKSNSIFKLHYKFDMGSWNDPLLPVAAAYLNYIGTDQYQAEEISKKFYNIACNFSINAGAEETIITISGLQENFGKAVGLFEQLILNCKPDTGALNLLKAGILKNRSDSKLDKSAIMKGLFYYALYGEKNPFNYTPSNKEIQALSADTLIEKLHKLFHYQHQLIYFGPASIASLNDEITKIHSTPRTFTVTPSKVTFKAVRQKSNQVLFTNYDMVQTEISWVRNAGVYTPSMEATIDLFNNYFGGGMGSVVFQNIRESKALAYSTYAFYGKPGKKEDSCVFVAYIGCQADKMQDAINGMNDLFRQLPVSQKAFNIVKQSEMKSLSISRIEEDNIVFTMLSSAKMGVNYDSRKKRFNEIPKVQFSNIQNFYNAEIAGKPFTYCIIGADKEIKQSDLEKIGPAKILSMEEIFGY